MPVAPKIVISYRRSDTIEISGRIYDWLKAHYGDDAVFMDVASNRPGYDYRREIREAMQNCRAVIAVIGPKWTGGNKRGHTRITDAEDPVRSELENALRLGKPIIPVLVSGARMPAPSKLPESLKDLTYIHAAEVDAAQDFDFHIERLIREIDRRLSADTPVVEKAQPAEKLVTTDYLAAIEKEIAPQVEHRELPLTGHHGSTDTHPSGATGNRSPRRLVIAVPAAVAATASIVGVAVWFGGGFTPTPPPKSLVPIEHTMTVQSEPKKEQAAEMKNPAAEPKKVEVVESKKTVVPVPKIESKYIGGLYGPLAVSPQPAPKALRTIVFSPDHRVLAAAGDDGIVRLWDANTFQIIRTLPLARWSSSVLRKAVRRIEFTPDGSKLVAAGFENAIRIWSVATGELVQILTDSQDGPDLQFYSLAVHAKAGQWIMAGAADGKIRIWDLQKELYRPVVRKQAHAGEVYAVRYSQANPDDYVSAGRDGFIRFYSVESTTSIDTKEKAIFCLQYYPGGDMVISGGTDQIVKLWRKGYPVPLRSFDRNGHTKSVLTSDLSQNGRMLLSGGDDHTIKLWNAETGELIHTFLGHKEDVEAVAFHPNGKWFVSVSEDGMLKVWDIATRKELLSIAVFDDDHYVAFTPAGRYTGDVQDSRHLKITYRDGSAERSIPDNDRKQLYVEPAQFVSAAGLN